MTQLLLPLSLSLKNMILDLPAPSYACALMSEGLRSINSTFSIIVSAMCSPVMSPVMFVYPTKSSLTLTTNQYVTYNIQYIVNIHKWFYKR